MHSTGLRVPACASVVRCSSRHFARGVAREMYSLCHRQGGPQQFAFGLMICGPWSQSTEVGVWGCFYFSRGRTGICQHGAFSGMAVIVASFVPAECPVGRGMWGIFGKPLKRAIWNTLGLHVVLTVCLRFLSFLDSACVACWLFLSTDSYHVRIQIHATCCCIP